MAELEAAKDTVEETAKDTQASVNKIVSSENFDPGASQYTEGQKAASDAESRAVQPKTLVEEIESMGEEIEQAGKEIKDSLYGLGKNPKLAGAEEEDTDQGGSGESDKAAS